jgi:hypothetical protein
MHISTHYPSGTVGAVSPSTNSGALGSFSTPFPSQPLKCPLALENLVPDIPPAFLIPEHHNASGIGITIETVTTVLKKTIPPTTALGTKILHVGGHAPPLIDTIDKAAELVKNIQQALDQGQNPEESITCQAVKTLTEAAVEFTADDVMILGIPAAIAATLEAPILAPAVVIGLVLIPEASAGAQTIGQLIGNITEAGCHHGFGLAKQLSSKGN